MRVAIGPDTLLADVVEPSQALTPPPKREEHHLAPMKMGETAISLLHDGRCFETGIDPAAACGRSRAWLSC